MIDTVRLLQDLIRCPSVTPEEGGALTLLETLLSAHGFTCHRLRFSDEGTPDVENLYARWGAGAPHICFAGHTDVVPVGDRAGWSFDPFGGEIRDGYVCGRGAADMKGAVAAFAAAAINFLEKKTPAGSISFLITGDEEAAAINGTVKVLDWMEKNGEKPDFCIVGEPTSREVLGDMVKIGRRGTFSGYLTVRGVQGHVAYPHLADNPIPRLLILLQAVDGLVLDAGTVHFQPSNLEIVNVEVSKGAENVIPAWCRAVFNVRFNDSYTGKTLERKLRETLDSCGLAYELNLRVGGESFYTPPGKYSEIIASAIEQATDRKPEFSTSGGTSDARFIRNHCPVIEFGLVGVTAHKADECVLKDDVVTLERIYQAILDRFFTS
jgi:succinyl-diaminopimelate desuccinylase